MFNINQDQFLKLLECSNFSEYILKASHSPYFLNIVEITPEEKEIYFYNIQMSGDQTYNPDPIFTETNLYTLIQMITDRYLNISSYVQANFNSDTILVANHLISIIETSNMLLYVYQKNNFSLLNYLVNFYYNYTQNGSYQNVDVNLKIQLIQAECRRINQTLALIPSNQIF